MNVIEAVKWSDGGGAVRIVDQRMLPGDLVERDLRTVEEVRDAIATLAVRGAPAIGICAAMGAAAALRSSAATDPDALLAELQSAVDRIGSARPTAVNLRWSLNRLVRAARSAGPGVTAILDAVQSEANAIRDEDAEMCRQIGEHGLRLLKDRSHVLTHCNAGALATGGIGTALAPIYLAAERGWDVHVYVPETRPLLQGSRLTAWELSRAGIDVTLLADSMAASLMASGRVDVCLVGADRIAVNGDVANKIGTYALAVLAHYHRIPFYVAAPSSTLDPDTASGASIVIEQRSGDELRRIEGKAIAPEAVQTYTPAFDVTPAALITGIITEHGIHAPPYDFSKSGVR